MPVRKLLALFALCMPLAAATHVVDVLYRGDGSLAKGTIDLHCSAMTADGKTITESHPSVQIVAGNVDVWLFANDAAQPSGTSCQATYHLGDNTAYTRTWTVPTSSGAVKIRDIEVQSPPNQSFMVLWQQMARNGALQGQGPIWNGTSWQPGSFVSPLLLTGNGAPGGGLGTTDDFYLDLAASCLYGPKGSSWPGTCTSLVGPQGTPAAKYSASFSSATTVSVPAATHLLTTPYLGDCRDSSGVAFDEGTFSVDGSANVTITFATPKTGACLLLGGSISTTVGGWSVDVEQPALQDSGIWQHKTKGAYVITALSCDTDQGAATVNMEIRTEAAPNSPGTAILSTPLVCGSSGTATSSPIPGASVPTNAPVALTISAISGSPGIVRVHVASN